MLRRDGKRTHVCESWGAHGFRWSETKWKFGRERFHGSTVKRLLGAAADSSWRWGHGRRASGHSSLRLAPALPAVPSEGEAGVHEDAAAEGGETGDELAEPAEGFAGVEEARPRAHALGGVHVGVAGALDDLAGVRVEREGRRRGARPGIGGAEGDGGGRRSVGGVAGAVGERGPGGCGFLGDEDQGLGGEWFGVGCEDGDFGGGGGAVAGRVGGGGLGPCGGHPSARHATSLLWAAIVAAIGGRCPPACGPAPRHAALPPGMRPCHGQGASPGNGPLDHF